MDYNKKGDKVLVSAHSGEIKKLGWKFNTSNIPCAYLTGYLLGIKAKKKNINEAILDIGLNTSTKGSRIYASLKGVIDAGLNITHKEEILPDEKRISGEHIKNYYEKVKKEKTPNQFNKYLKSNLNLQNIDKSINEIKTKIGK